MARLSRGDVDGGEMRRVCSSSVWGPGDLRDMMCRIVRLLLRLLKAQSVDVDVIPDKFFSEEMRYGYSTASTSTGTDG